jgi:hypothetical protein
MVIYYVPPEWSQTPANGQRLTHGSEMPGHYAIAYFLFNNPSLSTANAARIMAKEIAAERSNVIDPMHLWGRQFIGIRQPQQTERKSNEISIKPFVHLSTGNGPN